MPQLRHARLAGGVAVLIALGALAAGGSATAASTRPAPRPHRGTSLAERALATVEAALGQPASNTRARGAAPDRTGEITLALRDLRANLSSLGAADRRTAEAYLARPTDPSASSAAGYSRRAAETSDCKVAPHDPAVIDSHFCVHYVTSGADAPPLADNDHNDIPDQVDQTRTVMNHVWDAIVTQGGYHPPPSDGKQGGLFNGQSRFDVYLEQIGNQGLYGYCEPQWTVHTQFSNHAATSFCVLDDDYREFPNHTDLENLEVTGAHEFFHSVQFAYDYNDDTYFMENTATWVEDQIYTDINDNRQFLVTSSKNHPGRPLDSNAARYGNWIWWRYLTEQFPNTGYSDLPVLVRHAWDRAISTYSMKALSRTLSHLGTTIPQQLSGFGVASRHPGSTLGFSEGSAYSAAPVAATATFGSGARTTNWQALKLNHLSNGTVAFVPDSSYDAQWHLRVKVNGPASDQDPYAMLTVVPTSGEPTTQVVPLSGKGVGARSVSFDSTQVKQVELTLTNGNHAYRCGTRTNWACSGTPGSPAAFKFKATSFSS